MLKSSSLPSTAPLPRRGTASERQGGVLEPLPPPAACRGACRSTAHREAPRFSRLPTRWPIRKRLLATRNLPNGSATSAALLRPRRPLRELLAPALPSVAGGWTTKAAYGNTVGHSASALCTEVNPTGGALSSGTSTSLASAGLRQSRSRPGSSLWGPASCNAPSSPLRALGHRPHSSGIGAAPMRSTQVLKVSTCLRPAR
mmetsp:Transcript_120901/g.375785  ORF Transcript_120901/g.375785 Transcript_120901/m.375785 type:complete len:201 (-) Transcript_120901:1019-1621(-)